MIMLRLVFLLIIFIGFVVSLKKIPMLLTILLGATPFGGYFIQDAIFLIVTIIYIILSFLAFYMLADEHRLAAKCMMLFGSFGIAASVLSLFFGSFIAFFELMAHVAILVYGINLKDSKKNSTTPITTSS